MKKLLLLSFVSCSFGATPILVQYATTSSTLGGAVAQNQFNHIEFPNGSQAGNTLILGFQSNQTVPTFTIVDDQANTWVMVTNKNDTVNHQWAFVYVCTNCVANTRAVKIKTTSAASTGFETTVLAEFYNCTTVDVFNGAFAAAGSSASAGSITPTVTGDLIFQYVIRDKTSQGRTGFTAGSQANITWTKLTSDTQDIHASQYGVYNSTSAINPNMGMNISGDYISVCVALKAGTQGSAPPAGIRVASIHHLSVPTGTTTTDVVEVPSIGNLLVAAFSSGADTFRITGITDTSGNTWVESPGSPNNNGVVEQTEYWYAKNAITSPDLIVTVVFNSTSGPDGTIIFYDVAGADTSNPFDKETKSTGNQSSPADLNAPPNLTPSTANGLVIAQEQHNADTTSGITTLLFDSNWIDNQPVGASNNDQDGGWAHYYNTDTSAISFTWQFALGTQLNTWAAHAIAFKAATQAPSVSYNYSLTGSKTLRGSKTSR